MYVPIVGPTRVPMVGPIGVDRLSKPFVSGYVGVGGQEGLEIGNKLRGATQLSVGLR